MHKRLCGWGCRALLSAELLCVTERTGEQFRDRRPSYSHSKWMIPTVRFPWPRVPPRFLSAPAFANICNFDHTPKVETFF